MASKRHKRRRGCESKVKHSTKAEAAAHMRWLNRTLGHKYEIYLCSFCNRWHVGRPDRRQLQILAAKRADL